MSCDHCKKRADGGEPHCSDCKDINECHGIPALDHMSSEPSDRDSDPNITPLYI